MEKETFYKKYINATGCLVVNPIEYWVAQAVSRWLPTAAARFQSRVGSSGIYGGPSGAGAGFPCQSSFHRKIFHPHNHPGQVQ
jgi:hypothetical protein